MSTPRQAAAVAPQTACDIGIEGYPAQFRDAVRPDFALFDLRDEPQIVSVPSVGGCLRPVEWR